MGKPLHYRSIFISDVHLGTSDCQAELLFDFLASTSSDHLYLVGDIVDLWKCKHSIYWPRVKNDLVNLILEKARSGTKVIYVPGNHDELLRDFTGSHYHGVDLVQQAEHITADGQRLLVLHGDIFDEIVRTYHWLEAVGSGLYDFVLRLNRIYNATRKRLGYPYWSLAAFIKYRFKEAVSHIRNFEEAAARHAAAKSFDGIICGHIHAPNDTLIEGVHYFNTGDWVEHCTALTEDETGKMALIDWAAYRKQQLELDISPLKARKAA